MEARLLACLNGLLPSSADRTFREIQQVRREVPVRAGSTDQRSVLHLMLLPRWAFLAFHSRLKRWPGQGAARSELEAKVHRGGAAHAILAPTQASPSGWRTEGHPTTRGNRRPHCMHFVQPQRRGRAGFHRGPRPSYQHIVNKLSTRLGSRQLDSYYSTCSYHRAPAHFACESC